MTQTNQEKSLRIKSSGLKVYTKSDDPSESSSIASFSSTPSIDRQATPKSSSLSKSPLTITTSIYSLSSNSSDLLVKSSKKEVPISSSHTEEREKKSSMDNLSSTSSSPAIGSTTEGSIEPFSDDLKEKLPKNSPSNSSISIIHSPIEPSISPIPSDNEESMMPPPTNLSKNEHSTKNNTSKNESNTKYNTIRDALSQTNTSPPLSPSTLESGNEAEIETRNTQQTTKAEIETRNTQQTTSKHDDLQTLIEENRRKDLIIKDLENKLKIATEEKNTSPQNNDANDIIALAEIELKAMIQLINEQEEFINELKNEINK